MSDSRPITHRLNGKTPWSVAGVAGLAAIAMAVVTILDVPKCGDLQRKEQADRQHARIEKRIEKLEEKIDRGFETVVDAIRKGKKR